MMKQLLVASAVCLAALMPASAQPLVLDGITEPFHDVTLGLAEPGIIRHQFFQEGDVVKSDEVILELDTRLEELEVGRRKEVMEQDKEVMDSTEQLYGSTRSVSKQDLTKSEAEYNVAAADYAIAVQQLANRRLTSPFSGQITEILLHPGAACAPYQPLVRLVDTSRCYFVGQIDGTVAARPKLDQAVTIRMADGQSVTGKISFISPVVDAASGLACIKAIFENPDGKIRPGMAAKMTLP
jgi:membrane fusion protein (multidrug efflux system)